MRIATCTPVDFPADTLFFGRDSGLLCRGFQEAGHDCVVIMPGIASKDDAPDLVRCEYGELQSIEWWRQLNVQVVVLYAWGDPRYLPIARAIRSAGIFLVQSLDTSGIHTPYSGNPDWLQCLSAMLGGPLTFRAKTRLIARAIRDLLPGIYEYGRISMMDCCDRLAVVSEPAAEAITIYLNTLGYPQVLQKLLVVPHPVSGSMTPSPEPKKPKVMVVGRWITEDKAQKDPELTMAVLHLFLARHNDWCAEVVGRGSSDLDRLTGGWDARCRARLTLTEAVPRENLIKRYQESRILLCCSRFESYHISSAEAICCGCSIVVAQHPLLASPCWFTSKRSGTTAKSRNLRGFQTALDREVSNWQQGMRDPNQISKYWGHLLHANNVAANLLANINRQD